MQSGQLTERERQVAELIAWGRTYKEIPDALVEKYGGRPISVYTVQNILASIYAKTRTNRTNELAAWWFTHEMGVDVNLAPTPTIKQRLLSVLFLLILIPQIANSDLDQALRVSRTRTPRPARTERIERGRRRDE